MEVGVRRNRSTSTLLNTCEDLFHLPKVFVQSIYVLPKLGVLSGYKIPRSARNAQTGCGLVIFEKETYKHF